MAEQAPATPYMSEPGAHVKLIEQDVRLSRQQSIKRHNEHVLATARRRRRRALLRRLLTWGFAR